MNNSLRRWFDTIPLTDPVEHRQASVFQYFLLGWLVLASIGVPLLAVSGAQAPNPSPELQLSGSLLSLASTLLWLSPAIALVVLRRGHFRRAVGIAAIGPLISQAFAMVLLGVVPSALILFFVPITFAGLLAGRRLLLTVAGLSVLTVAVVAILESLTPPMAGFFTRALNSATGVADTGNAAAGQGSLLGFFFVVVALLTLLFDRFGSTLRDALITSLEREAELSSIRASLETIVAERTAALQSALDDVEARAEEQEHLLREIELQRETIKDLNVPVIPISATTLVMPLVGALDSTRLRHLQEQSLQALERTSARVLILDITGVPVVDSHVAQGLLMTVRSARLLGAEVSLVGIRPEVAQTIVGLGIELRDVRTFSDLHSALDRISA